MPELAEVEVVRRNLETWWQGRAASQICIIDEDLLEDTAPDDLEEALLRPLKHPHRRGKYLICHLDGGQSVVFHFRMTGKIICCDEAEPKYARLSWHIPTVGWLVFKDQRRLGRAQLFNEEELADYEPLRKMGPEPGELTVEYLRQKCSDRRLLKTALLDQSVVAGVGNIAISELFWRLRFAPEVKCGHVDDDEMKKLIDEMPRYFDEIIARSMADEVMYVEEANMQNIFQVYRRDGEQCPRCGAPIDKKTVGGRTSYYCPQCQP